MFGPDLPAGSFPLGRTQEECKECCMRRKLRKAQRRKGGRGGGGADDVKEKTRVRRDQIRKRLIVFTHAMFNKRKQK